MLIESTMDPVSTILKTSSSKVSSNHEEEERIPKLNNHVDTIQKRVKYRHNFLEKQEPKLQGSPPMEFVPSENSKITK